MQTIAGTETGGYNGDNIAATSAQINGPEALQTYPSGDVLFADTQNHRIRHVNVGANIISTVIGTGTPGYAGLGGPGNQVQLNQPAGVSIGSVPAPNTLENILVGAAGPVDNSTGQTGGGARPASSCTLPRASVSSADLMLMTLALGIVLGRKRVRRYWSMLTQILARPRVVRNES
jgi:hypothetical protein